MIQVMRKTSKTEELRKPQEIPKERLCQECWTSIEKAEKVNRELTPDEPYEIKARGSEKPQEIMKERLCRECRTSIEKAEKTNQELTPDESYETNSTESSSDSDDESVRSVEDFINKIKAGGPEKPQEISK